MARTSQKRSRQKPVELDSVYLLKMLLYLIVGSLWLRITTQTSQIPIPVGFIVGILFTMHERLQIDRKLEYAILLMAMFIGFWLPIGLEIIS